MSRETCIFSGLKYSNFGGSRPINRFKENISKRKSRNYRLKFPAHIFYHPKLIASASVSENVPIFTRARVEGKQLVSLSHSEYIYLPC